jgi:hypothetical protein
MNKIDNPFCPGAGSQPPELAGRDDIIEQAEILLARTRLKRPEKSLLLTGLRGVGKTVLLNKIELIAKNNHYKTIFIEAHDQKSLPELLAPHLQKLLLELSELSGLNHQVKQAWNALKNFVNGLHVKSGEIEIGFNFNLDSNIANNFDLEVDLPYLFIAVAEAALEKNMAIAIFIDELQYCTMKELSALIMAMHRMQQRVLPLILIGAGLPTLPGLVGESKSYAERLFNFPDLGPLSEEDARKALVKPVEEQNVNFDDEALKSIFEITKGYPYFLQEWGYQAWNHATTSPITEKIIEESFDTVIKRLDENFFRVRFGKLTQTETHYLRAMAELGVGPYRTSDISEKMGKTSSNQVSTIRNSLIKKGIVYSPSHGEMAFTVPLFDEFMRRTVLTNIDLNDEN